MKGLGAATSSTTTTLSQWESQSTNPDCPTTIGGKEISRNPLRRDPAPPSTGWVDLNQANKTIPRRREITQLRRQAILITLRRLSHLPVEEARYPFSPSHPSLITQIQGQKVLIPLILTQWTSQCFKNSKSPCILPRFNPYHHYSSKCLRTSGSSSNSQLSRRKDRPLGRARSGGSRITHFLTSRSSRKCSRQLHSQWKALNSQIRSNLGLRNNRNYAGQEVWLRRQVSWNSLRMAVLISNLLTILHHGRMLLARGFTQRVSAQQNRVRHFSDNQARPLSFNPQSTKRIIWAKVSEGHMTPDIQLPIPPQRGNTWSENLRRGWSISIRNLSLGNLIGHVLTKTTII